MPPLSVVQVPTLVSLAGAATWTDPVAASLKTAMAMR